MHPAHVHFHTSGVLPTFMGEGPKDFHSETQFQKVPESDTLITEDM